MEFWGGGYGSWEGMGVLCFFWGSVLGYYCMAAALKSTTVEIYNGTLVFCFSMLGDFENLIKRRLQHAMRNAHFS